MSSFLIIQFGAPVLAALIGGAAGWLLRGRPTAPVKPAKHPETSQKRVAANVLQGLQAAADTVRACVEQHSDCIKAVMTELQQASAEEPVLITKLADKIVESNELVKHQCDDIRKSIHDKRQEIRDCLTNSDRLLFTFASLDRQEQAYRQVLSSLEVLAAELSGQIKGHGQKLQKINGELEGSDGQTAPNLASAVTQILDATADVQQKVNKTEQRIEAHAESVEMQAILSHADLLTSLPNRKALVAELQRAATQARQTPKASLIIVDLDSFSDVNDEYGHQGGDAVLRQVGAAIKKLVRGRDMVARYKGDVFALLLNQTTLHDALPVAEKVRKQINDTQFSHGANKLRVTASLGIAQLQPEEMLAGTTDRVEQALAAAKETGGNSCFRHDGETCVAVSSVFQAKPKEATETLSLASLWRDSSSDAAQDSARDSDPNNSLSGRSLFAANLNRRLAEWKRGGSTVSVAVMRIDQLDELVGRFGDQGQWFLRQVMGRLLEAATRDMDERCEFEDGLFALLLPATDETSALAVADRLCAQVRQCKVRMGSDLWDLTASIGVAHCTVADRVMDIMRSAENAMEMAAKGGGDGVCVGQAVANSQAAPVV